MSSFQGYPYRGVPLLNIKLIHFTITIGGGLQDSFLADPYVGVVLLVLVLLLIAVVCILGIMLCYYVRQNYISQRSVT